MQVIYDQFQWNDPEHLEVLAPDDGALDIYRFFRTMYPERSLGMCPVEEYRKIKPQKPNRNENNNPD